MNNETTAENTKEISNMEALILLMQIPKEAEIMLKFFEPSQVYGLFNDKEARSCAVELFQENILTWQTIIKGIEKLESLIENKDEILNNCPITYYDNLPREKKKEFCLKMISNEDFQRDLCNITLDELEKREPEISILAALNIKRSFPSPCNS